MARFFVFTLYGVFSVGGVLLLFKLVEERERSTVDLEKVQPAGKYSGLMAKITVASVAMVLDFIVCQLVVRVPYHIGEILVIIATGTAVSIVFGMFMAYYARNQSQALALLKPLVTVLVLALPALGLFAGGPMHKLALIDPFYWLLMVMVAYSGEQSPTGYLTALIALIGISIIVLKMTWHRTPYGISR